MGNGKLVSELMSNVRFRVDKASDADLNKLAQCSEKFAFVQSYDPRRTPATDASLCRSSCTSTSTRSSRRSSSGTSRRCGASRSSWAAPARAAWSPPRATRPDGTGCTARCRAPRLAGAARRAAFLQPPFRRVPDGERHRHGGAARAVAAGRAAVAGRGLCRLVGGCAGGDLDADAVRGIAERLRTTITARTALVASIGAGTSKLVAKIASDLDKPDGLLVVPPGDELGVLYALPVTRLWGVGPATAQRLQRIGVTTVAALAAGAGGRAGRPARARGRHGAGGAGARPRTTEPSSPTARPKSVGVRGDVRDRPGRCRAAARRARPDGQQDRAPAAGVGPLRAHGQPQGPAARLPYPQPVAHAARRDRRRGGDPPGGPQAVRRGRRLAGAYACSGSPSPGCPTTSRTSCPISYAEPVAATRPAAERDATPVDGAAALGTRASTWSTKSSAGMGAGVRRGPGHRAGSRPRTTRRVGCAPSPSHPD